MKRWGVPCSLLVIVVSRWVALGGSGRVSSFACFGMLSKGRSGKRWDAVSLSLDAASHWANRAAVFAKGSSVDRSNVLSLHLECSVRWGEACKVRTLCRSLLDDTSEEVGQKRRWTGALGKARGRCGVWQVGLGSSSRVWLRIPVERGDALLFSSECLSERDEV